MRQQIAKFLEFNGKNLVFLSKDGVYWIAVKPICEAIGVDYIQQFKNLKSDLILSGVLCKHTMHLDRMRSLICLPEMYVYGWIFSIRSDSKQLIEYKLECYKILFNHFHGTITNRVELLKEKARITNERYKAENSLKTMPEYQQLENLKTREISLGKALAKNDNEFITEQLKLFN